MQPRTKSIIPPPEPAPEPTAASAVRGASASRNFDLAVASQLLATMRPMLEAIPQEQLLTLTWSVGPAAATAMAVAEHCNQEHLRPKFEALSAAKLWSIRALDALPNAALVAYYVDLHASEAEAAASGAKLPEDVVKEASEVRERMLHVLRFLFEKDATLGPVTRSMGTTRSYHDLAANLLRCAELYDEHAGLVSAVPLHYRATDRSDAERLGADVMRRVTAMGESSAETWSSLRRRAATHLAAIYNEVARAGRFVEAVDEKTAETRYPSLASAGRAPKKTKKSRKKPDAPKDPAKPA